MGALALLKVTVKPRMPHLQRDWDGSLRRVDEVVTPITKILPLYRSTSWRGVARPRYVHRIRHADMLVQRWSLGGRGRYDANVRVYFWCGVETDARNGTLLAAPPPDAPICGTCEGRAVGAGEPSLAFLTQLHDLIFTPRK